MNKTFLVGHFESWMFFKGVCVEILRAHAVHFISE